MNSLLFQHWNTEIPMKRKDSGSLYKDQPSFSFGISSSEIKTQKKRIFSKREQPILTNQAFWCCFPIKMVCTTKAGSKIGVVLEKSFFVERFQEIEPFFCQIKKMGAV